MFVRSKYNQTKPLPVQAQFPRFLNFIKILNAVPVKNFNLS